MAVDDFRAVAGEACHDAHLTMEMLRDAELRADRAERRAKTVLGVLEAHLARSGMTCRMEENGDLIVQAAA